MVCHTDKVTMVMITTVQTLVTSPNMENLDSACVDDVHQKTHYRPFLVKSELGWLQDR